jgi:hypothetical protein
MLWPYTFFFAENHCKKSNSRTAFFYQLQENYQGCHHPLRYVLFSIWGLQKPFLKFYFWELLLLNNSFFFFYLTNTGNFVINCIFFFHSTFFPCILIECLGGARHQYRFWGTEQGTKETHILAFMKHTSQGIFVLIVSHIQVPIQQLDKTIWNTFLVWIWFSAV